MDDKLTEEERLQATIARSEVAYAPRRGRMMQPLNPSARPPPDYICHRCGQQGHYKQFCDGAAAKRLLPTTGIPMSDLTPTVWLRRPTRRACVRARYHQVASDGFNGAAHKMCVRVCPE